jgi:lipopolysaccharide/colanic/teichoic acid biosynthesis glycosyltransferase
MPKEVQLHVRLYFINPENQSALTHSESSFKDFYDSIINLSVIIVVVVVVIIIIIIISSSSSSSSSSSRNRDSSVV